MPLKTPEHCCHSSLSNKTLQVQEEKGDPTPTTMCNEGCELVSIQPSRGRQKDFTVHMESNPHN